MVQLNPNVSKFTPEQEEQIARAIANLILRDGTRALSTPIVEGDVIKLPTNNVYWIGMLWTLPLEYGHVYHVEGPEGYVFGDYVLQSIDKTPDGHIINQSYSPALPLHYIKLDFVVTPKGVEFK